MSADIKLDEVPSNDSLSEKNTKVVDPKSEKSEEWASLSGGSQERFQQLANKRKEAEEQSLKLKEENEKLRKDMEDKITQMKSNQPNQPQENSQTANEQLAFARLKNIGMATRDEQKNEIDKLRQEFQAEKDREKLNSEHSRLETKYSSDGLPKYDSKEIEDYMRKEGIYNPEAAYRNKYFDELKNSTVSTNHQSVLQTKSKIDETDVWTPERLAERLRKPDAREFFLKNQSKIDRLEEKWKEETE